MLKVVGILIKADGEDCHLFEADMKASGQDRPIVPTNETEGRCLQKAKELFGEGLVPSEEKPSLPYAPWHGYIEGYDPRKTFFVLDPETQEVIGKVGLETDLTMLKRGAKYPVVVEKDESFFLRPQTIKIIYELLGADASAPCWTTPCEGLFC